MKHSHGVQILGSYLPVQEKSPPTPHTPPRFIDLASHHLERLQQFETLVTTSVIDNIGRNLVDCYDHGL